MSEIYLRKLASGALAPAKQQAQAKEGEMNGATLQASSRCGMTVERLEWHLQNWRSWMHAGIVTEGLPRETAGLFSSGSAHFDDLVEACDRRCARACDTVINDLPPAQSSAIHRRYLYAVWRFPRLNFERCLELAKAEIKTGLERRGIW